MAEYAIRLANGLDTAARMRMGDALGLSPGGATLAKQGFRDDGGGVVSITNGTMTATVQPFSAWIDGSTSNTQGGYPFICDAAKNLTVTDGHASLARVDTVVAQVRDTAFDGSGFTDARVYIVTGSPGGGAPAVPASAIPLRDINVPAGASAGAGGLTAANLGADRRVFTTGLGGVLTVASQTERDALSPRNGNLVYRADTDGLQVKASGGWRDLPHQSASPVNVLSSLTASAGWTLTSAEYVKFGPMVALYVIATRTGVDMGPLSSGGNLSPDVAVFTGVPAAIRPTGTVEGTLHRPNIQTGTIRLDPAGAATFTDGVGGATYTGGGTAYGIRFVYALGL